MIKQKIGKRQLAREAKVKTAQSTRFLGLAAVLGGAGTLVFPGVGTLCGIAVARAIVRRQSKNTTTNPSDCFDHPVL